MKKSYLFSTLILSTLIMASGCTKKSDVSSERAKEVIVYTYDSFCGEWGSGPEIARLFTEKTGYNVTYVDCGDGVEILSKALLEKNNTYADVLLGFDNNLSDKIIESRLLMEYKPADADKLISKDLSSELNKDGKWLMTPYDYSHFAMIFDTLSGLPAPQSLEDLTKDIYKNKIILMNPKTSTPGLGFETWAKLVYGDNFEDYWERVSKNVLTFAPGWSSGYGMFTSGEAPLVISYTTSPAYHVEYGEGDRFQALIFEQGHVRQIEGAGILKGAKNPAGAKAFLDFLISDEAQNVLPLTQWMFPANKNVVLPESYKVAAPIPAKTLK